MSKLDLAEIRATKFSHRDHEADAETIALVVKAGVSTTNQKYDSPFDSQHPIRQVGKQQYTEFRATAEELGQDSLPWSEVEHGFIVISSGIIKCIHAYSRWLKNNCEAEYDKTQLKDALLSPRTISFFLKVSGISEIENREYEAFFSLRTTYADGDYDEFTYDPEENYFSPNPIHEAEAEEEAACRRYELIKAGIDQSEFGSCPAIKFIPLFWRGTVEACDAGGLFDQNNLEDEPCEQSLDRTY